MSPGGRTSTTSRCGAEGSRRRLATAYARCWRPPGSSKLLPDGASTSANHASSLSPQPSGSGWRPAAAESQ
eukprot:7272698-Lingulodinium_polyedra.AAC.1